MKNQLKFTRENDLGVPAGEWRPFDEEKCPSIERVVEIPSILKVDMEHVGATLTFQIEHEPSNTVIRLHGVPVEEGGYARLDRAQRASHETMKWRIQYV